MSSDRPGDLPPYDPTRPASPDVLATYGDEPPPRHTPWLLVGAAAVAVLALVGGVTYGVGQLSGGGSQPEDALPAGAFGFAKVDLDPAAGQKIDGFRFMRKFPALREKLGDDEDLREVVFEALADGVPGWDDVDFDSQVAPWMGRRVGVAAYAPGRRVGVAGYAPLKAADPAEPTVVVALQVTDAEAAREGLERLARAAAGGEAGGPALGVVVAGDYALLAETQRVADRAARDAEGGVLATDEDLTADLSAAGDGVMAAWLDMDRAVKALGTEALGMGSFSGMAGTFGGATGRSTFVARFDGPDVFEVSGRVTGADAAGWATHSVRGFEELPESSVVAFGLADGEELVPRLYESFRKAFDSSPVAREGQAFDEMVAEAERELGIEVPEDLAALLGDNLLAALDSGPSDSLEVGARITTDVERAERVLAAIEKTGVELPVVRRIDGDDLLVASTPAQADRLATAGTLGDRPGFDDALPDLDNADVAVLVDVKAVVAAVFGAFAAPDGPAEVDPNLEPIEGLGFTASSRDEGSGSFRIRLVAR